MLVDPVEHQRRDQRAKDAAKDAADRHCQIEERQLAGRRASFEQAAVQGHPGREQIHDGGSGKGECEPALIEEQREAGEQKDQRGKPADRVGRTTP